MLHLRASVTDPTHLDFDRISLPREGRLPSAYVAKSRQPVSPEFENPFTQAGFCPRMLLP